MQKAVNSDLSTGRRAFGGLLVRKTCWTLSLPARLIIFLFCVGLSLAGIRWACPFLSVTHRVPANFLIVEGWVPPYALTRAESEFKSGGYRKILTSGCRADDVWDSKPDLTYADMAAARFKELGMPTNDVSAAPCLDERRDRTYSSALAVKEWLEKHGESVTSLDVLTLGPHARRTRLLYREAFGSGVKIGIISVENREYDPSHWWWYSEGVREVTGEAIAYIYAKFLFWPSTAKAESGN